MKSVPNVCLQQAHATGWAKSAPALVSGLVALLLYAVTLGGGYVYDDVLVVHDDERLHHPAAWGRYWTSDYFDGGIDNLYRPLVSMSYAIEWWVHGDRPWIFHAVNLLLHALAAAGVAEFTRRALGAATTARSAGLCAGLLFAAHPVHVEAVANIVGRAELACTGAILLGLILLCKPPLSLMRVGLIVAVGIVGMLCKEQGILQPLLWLFLGILLVRLHPASRLRLLVLLTSWSWAVYLIARERLLKFEWDRTYMDPIIQPLIRSIGTDRLLMPLVLLGHYLALLAWPRHLSPDYGGTCIGWTVHLADRYFWAGLIGVAGGVSLMIWSAIQRQKFILFCMLGFCLTYAVIGNIVTLIGTNFAERLIYLPSAFLLMIGGNLIARLPGKIRMALMAVALLLGSFRTFTAAREWNHPAALFESGLKAQPKSFQLHLLLSQAYHAQGKLPQANFLLENACRLYPDYWRAWLFRSLEAMDDGQLAEAEQYLMHARKLDANPLEISAMERLEKLKAVKPK